MEKSRNNSIHVPVVLLDDCEEIVEMIVEFCSNSKFIFHTGTSVEEGFRLVENQKLPFILLTDLEMGTHLGTEIIQKCFDENLNILGTIVISGRFDLHEYVQKLHEQYPKTIPFFTLSKPFDMYELDNLLEQIVESNPQNLLCLHSNKAGMILTKARKTLDIEPQLVVAAANAAGLNLTLDSYLKLETAEEVDSEITGSDWFLICKILNIPSESYQMGYCDKLHLGRIRGAIRDGEMRFPISAKLMQALENLDPVVTCKTKNTC